MGGGRRGRGSGRERGADLRYNMEITLEDAYAGKAAQMRIPTSVTCEACSGSGAKAGTKPKTCQICGGQGRVRHAQGFFTLERTCPICQGRGQVIDSPCASCSGSGRVTRERTLSVNIPPGVEDGTRIRLAGEGEAGVRGGPPGDLYIFLSIGAHPFFQRDGADLHCRVPVSMVTAALGGEFEVPTIDGGKTRVKVPEGTQSGRRFRLSGKGMPVLRARQTGDMYVQVVVETPQNLTKRQRELLAEFDKLRRPRRSRNPRDSSARSRTSSTGSAPAPIPGEPFTRSGVGARAAGLAPGCFKNADFVVWDAFVAWMSWLCRPSRNLNSRSGGRCVSWRSGKTSSSARSNARSGCSSKSAMASARRSKRRSGSSSASKAFASTTRCASSAPGSKGRCRSAR